MISSDSSILLVDDSLAMRQTVKNILNAAGYRNIHIASDGKEALGRINTAAQHGEMFRVIFLDWNMPEMDGLEFLKACRADPRTKNVAIVMLTAVSDQKSVVTAMNSGATSYITKPVSSDTLLKKLGQVSVWLENRRENK